MRILILDKLVPYPPTDGSLLRVYNLIKQISRQHEVSLITLFKPLTGEDSVAAHLRTLCRHVEFIGRPEYSVREFRLLQLQGALKREPMRYMTLYSEKMADKVRTLIQNNHIDIVDIERLCVAPYIQAIASTSQCAKVLGLHDVPYVQYRRMMSVERDWRAKRRLFFMDLMFSKQATLKYARCFDKCVVVSESDRSTLKQAGPDLDIAVVPNGVDTQTYFLLPNPPAAPTLLFVGSMNYPPNVDGAIFFCQEVFPLIKQRVPDAKLLIVGQKPSRAVQALASDDVTVTGFVESVLPYYQQASVFVVPLRAGGGSRLKILESMALGRPVVSTTLGCEGLSVTCGENILIADTPSDFAAQVVRLLDDEEQWRYLVTSGRRLVETRYDWQIIAQELVQVYEQAAGKRKTLGPG
jgi:glycosyltransferase involved in cell wall biosynthesis